MKFDLAALRGLSEKNKPRVEAERREQEAYWKAKGEADRRAREEAEYQTAIAGIESKVKWAAQNGKRYAKLEDWAPPALNIFQNRGGPGIPKLFQSITFRPFINECAIIVSHKDSKFGLNCLNVLHSRLFTS